MGWRLPPIGIQQRVQDAFGGTDQYRRLSEAWYNALERLPGPVPAYSKEQQYRENTAGELRGAEGIADPTSVHYLGLARDVGWRSWPIAYKRQVAGYLEQQGLAVERAIKARALRYTTGRIPTALGRGIFGELLPGHLHYGVPKAQVRAAGLIPLISSVVRGLQVAGR